MPLFCLTKEHADKFLNGIKSGKIKPAELLKLKSSAEREAAIAPFVGEGNKKFAVEMLESKILLKNQQRGFITWAKTFGGLKPKDRSDFIAKVGKLEKILSPDEAEGFMSDAVQKKFGIGLTHEEGQTIMSLTKQAEGLYKEGLEDWQQSRDYQRIIVKLQDFLEEATPEHAATTVLGKAQKYAATAVSLQRAGITSIDVSALGRQARVYIGTKEFNQAMKRIPGYIKSDDAITELKVDMMKHPYSKYAMQFKKKLGITVLGEKSIQHEEQFGAKLTRKIPGIAQSGRAYEGFLSDLRFNRFVNQLENLDKAGWKDKMGRGITENPEMMENLAKVIGASTGRGQLGSLEPAANALATGLFAPRLYMGRIQTLLNPLIKTGPARKEAMLGLTRLVGTSAAVLGGLAAAGLAVELDTRSSDFGQVKIGDHRVDITGGLGQFIVLFSRLGMGIAGQPAFKSTTTGKIRKLNEPGYGKQTTFDVMEDFVENKASPLFGIFRDIAKGKDFEGNKVDVNNPKQFAKFLANQLLVPLIAKDIMEVYKNSGGDIKMTAGLGTAAFLGFNVNSYKPYMEDKLNKAGIKTDKNSKATQELTRLYKAGESVSITNFETSTSKDVAALKEKVGEKEFENAMKMYADEVTKEFEKSVNHPKYQSMSDDEKAKQLSKDSDIALERVMEKYFGVLGLKKLRKESRAKPMKYISK